MTPSSAGLADWFVASMGTAAEQPTGDTRGQCWPAGTRGTSQGNDSVSGAKQQDAFKSLPEVEESLEELTALCTDPVGEASAVSAVIPLDMPKNKATALLTGVTGDLERADTHDSTSTANLLPFLQPRGASKQPLPLPDEPGGSPDTTAGLICAGNKESIKADAVVAAGTGSSEADAKASAAYENEDVDDTPLVSKRTNSILDIMCGRSPLNTACAGSPMRATLQHTLSFLHSYISTASTGSIAFSPTTSGGGLGATASGTSGGSLEPWGLGASISDASVPSILAGGASSSGASIVPSSASGSASVTAEAAPAVRLLYVGVFLTPESREVLSSMVPPMHALLRGDHMAVVYKPSVQQLLQFPLGAEVELRVLGSAADGRVQAVFVEGPSWLATSASAHITVSVAVGAKAVAAGQLIREALQQAALASAADLAYAPAGLGSYQPFDEPLPLIGRLGVWAAVPAATAVSMGWAGMGAAQLAAGEAEVAVYSVDELVQSGYFSIDKGALEGFYRQHGAKLGKQVPSSLSPLASPLALPAVPESAAALDDSLSSACATPDASVKLLSSTATPANSNASPWLLWVSAHATSPDKSALHAAISPSRALLGLVGVADSPAGATAVGSYSSSPMPDSSPPPSGYGAFGVAAVGGGGSATFSGSAVAASPASGGLAALLSARGSSASAAAAREAQATRGLAALLTGAAGSTGGQATLPASGPSSGGGLAALLAAAAGGSGGGGATTSPSAADGLVSAQLPAVSTGRPGSAPPAAATQTPRAEPLACAAAVSDADEAEFHSPKSYSSGGSSTDSMEAVQFLSAVHEGDYVAVRPFVPTEDNERLVQGYVREFACDEPFQAEGVLVVLSDHTIGYVAIVLDSKHGSQGGSSSSATAKHSSSKKQTTSKSSSKLKKAHFDAHSGFSSDLTEAATAGVVAGGSGLSGPLQQWLADAGAELHPVMASADPRCRTARDADRDLQLWHEFEALQQQYGEDLCNTILESCNQDFAEAIELIKGQAGGLQAAAGSNSSSAAAASPTRTPGSAARPAAAAGAAASPAGASDDFVCQLALSLGLLPEDALQLARLVPHLSADAVVRELQKHSGDVGMAADALLSNQASGAAADGSSNSSSGASSPAAGSRGDSSPEERAMRAFRAGKDPELIVAAQRLCEMSLGLTTELAELLLAEHGGNLHEAAQALSDMQACELEVRSAAADEAAASSSGMAGMHGLSAADRKAIMEAMGQCEPQQQQEEARQIPQAAKHQQQQQQSTSPVRSSPVHSTSPPRRQGLTPQAQAGPSRYSSAQPGSYYGCPPPPPPRQQAVQPPPLHVALVDAFAARETARQAKEKVDAFYRKATVLNEVIQTYMQAYKAAAEEGDRDKARQLLAEITELKKKHKERMAEASAKAFQLHNPDCKVWDIDLHGQSVPKAMDRFVKQLNCLIDMEQPGGILFKVIVGQGHHSEDNVPKIKNQVQLYLKEQSELVLAETGEPWPITYQVDPTNAGCIHIRIPPKETADS